jgi:hypothetical protein
MNVLALHPQSTVLTLLESQHQTRRFTDIDRKRSVAIRRTSSRRSIVDPESETVV